MAFLRIVYVLAYDNDDCNNNISDNDLDYKIYNRNNSNIHLILLNQLLTSGHHVSSHHIRGQLHEIVRKIYSVSGDRL